MNGKDSTCIPKPAGDVVTLGDAKGDEGERIPIAWPHDQVRAWIEEDNPLFSAYLKLIEDENILANTSTVLANDEDELAGSIQESQSSLSSNDKYPMAVTRNNDVAKEQAFSYVSYASNQVQMLNETKEYASLLKMCRHALAKLTDLDYQDEKKVFLKNGTLTKYVKVQSFRDLECLACGMNDDGLVDLYYEKNGVQIVVQDERDFETIEEDCTIFIK